MKPESWDGEGIIRANGQWSCKKCGKVNKTNRVDCKQCGHEPTLGRPDIERQRWAYSHRRDE